jgi:glycosyltransferase involved in cell wall biosynthesis
LLEAWRHVKFPDARLVIAGKGPEEEQLRAFARGKGLSNVEFRGFVPPEEQIDLWPESIEQQTCLFTPAFQETFGLVALESQACGTP